MSFCSLCERTVPPDWVEPSCDLCGFAVCDECDDELDKLGYTAMVHFHVDRRKCLKCIAAQLSWKKRMLDQLTHREWRQCGKNSRGNEIFDPIKLHLHQR
jgi:hypothetical protein